MKNESSFSTLTFDELFDLVEDNKFRNETDLKIAQAILSSERDWRNNPETIEAFISELEKEMNGKITKFRLEKRLTFYSKRIHRYAWEAESMSELMIIFKLSRGEDLRSIIHTLFTKV